MEHFVPCRVRASTSFDLPFSSVFFFLNKQMHKIITIFFLVSPLRTFGDAVSNSRKWLNHTVDAFPMTFVIKLLGSIVEIQDAVSTFFFI